MIVFVSAFIMMLAAMFLPWQGDLGTIHQWTIANPWHAVGVVWVNFLLLFVWGWKRWGDRMEQFDNMRTEALNGSK